MATSLTPEQLLQINRLTLQARFVSGMAHELNNSLQVMTGLVELLSDRTDLPDDVRARIRTIGGQAERAGAVVREVLGYTREQAGGRRRVDLPAVVDQALALRRYRLGRAGIDVSWDRSAHRRCAVMGDERQLLQVILNLLVNAEEALAGQSPRALRLTVEPDSPMVRCIVADTGPGVPPDLRERVFEPFFSTRLSESNIGLGLTAAAAISAAHGGRLFLAEGGAGATFVMELPEA